ncbi:HD domain-containing protein [Cohnella sp. OV330]|uniref:HD-GYP domain-containing protein n=1 Tax=Cohnella sp. OV330 TaxID=1855288 RepID=UPI0008E6A640|nr:HD-GYP domain-containing protein [Cohnella sp. OV330]SFB39629.1 HD domain-containing protein [Cohnella sp. OV330]
MRIHITDLQAGDQISQDIFNGYGLHVLSSGAILNEHDLSRLYQHRIEYVDIEQRVSPSFEASETAADLFPPELHFRFEDAVVGCELLFKQAIVEGRISEADAKESFQPLVRHFQEERDVVSLMLSMHTQDEYTYQHSVQVGMLSFYMAKWLDWSDEDQIRAGMAGFLHDIGKSRISEELLKKSGRLTEAEFEEIKKHPLHSYRILTDSYPDDGIAVAALQHHERRDGTGYPERLQDEAILPMSRVIAIADIYSAMTSDRIHQEKRDLLCVLKELYRLSFNELDAEMTQTFINRMIPNFIGKRAQLSDGRWGTIIMTHPTDPFRPLIHVDDAFIDLAVERDLEIDRIST